ncbi:MAG: hypothetical protein ACTJFR_09760 [Canibacter sp.]
MKTLEKDLAEFVARHLAMVAKLIHTDPEAAHAHALSAARRAGRIPVARETLAMTAYAREDFAMTLRELRTYRRLTGKDTHLALMVDSERGMGRPEKALETARDVDLSTLTTEQRVHTAIAVSGARLDLGQTKEALLELEIPELNPNKAFLWSAELFRAYAAVLEDLGRESDAKKWSARADEAEDAIVEAFGGDEIEIFEIEELEDEAVEIPLDEKTSNDEVREETE